MRITPNDKASPPEGGVSKMRLKWGTDGHPIIGPGIVVDQTRFVAGGPVKVDGVAVAVR